MNIKTWNPTLTLTLIKSLVPCFHVTLSHRSNTTVFFETKPSLLFPSLEDFTNVSALNLSFVFWLRLVSCMRSRCWMFPQVWRHLEKSALSERSLAKQEKEVTSLYLPLTSYNLWLEGYDSYTWQSGSVGWNESSTCHSSTHNCVGRNKGISEWDCYT